jgi:broad specificity phosphatase PhoE
MSVHTVVHFLRHGEVLNPTKILYGRLTGFRLSPLGEQMAKAAAKALATHDVTVIVSSPLERAVQTAEPFAAQFGLDVSTDDRLIESANFFEGKRVSVGDGALRDPRNWWALRDPFAPSWGESYRAIAERMHAALLDIRERAEGHEAVCVSHQLPIWTLRRHMEGKRLWHASASAAWPASPASTSTTPPWSVSAIGSRPRTSSPPHPVRERLGARDRHA